MISIALVIGFLALLYTFAQCACYFIDAVNDLHPRDVGCAAVIVAALAFPSLFYVFFVFFRINF